jgi:hypothetical protein
MIRLTNKISTVDKDSGTINGRLKRPAPNKMFAQWCGDVLLKVYIFVPRFCVGDRTRLRNRTTAQTQTLAATNDQN